jgi:hypothetical protein
VSSSIVVPSMWQNQMAGALDEKVGGSRKNRYQIISFRQP